MKLRTWIVLLWLTAVSAFAQCEPPPLDFQDNLRGDYRYTVWSWQDPPGCTFFLEGTRTLEPDANAIWFTLEPTYSFRFVTFTNGMYRISPITKRVIIDMEDFSEPGADDGSPFAPQCWYVRPKLY